MTQSDVFAMQESMMSKMMVQMMQGGMKGWGGKGDDDWGKGNGKGKGKDKGKGKSKSKGKSAGAKKENRQQNQAKKQDKVILDLPWKTRLSQAYQKVHRIPATKESLVYTVEKVGDEGYTCSLAGEKFTNSYVLHEAVETKKLAEEHAAMKALESEFPEVWEAVPESVREAGAVAAINSDAERKETEGPKEITPKSQLNSDVQVMFGAGRSATKGDIEYTVSDKGDMKVATVKLNCFEDGKKKTFKGEPAATPTEAENNAATKAMEELADVIEAKRLEHVTRKEEKKAFGEARAAAAALDLVEQEANTALAALKKKKVAR